MVKKLQQCSLPQLGLNIKVKCARFDFRILFQKKQLLKMVANKSIVWNFFKVKATNFNKVICNLCNSEFSLGASEETICKTKPF